MAARFQVGGLVRHRYTGSVRTLVGIDEVRVPDGKVKIFELGDGSRHVEKFFRTLFEPIADETEEKQLTLWGPV